MSAPTTTRTARTLDRYELGAPLGTGGYATVYRARHVHTRQEVAVKVLAPRGALDLELWLAEGRAMGAIDHPNVMRVRDSGIAETGEAFLVTDLVERGSLENLLANERLTPCRAVAYAEQMLAGLAAVHAQGIVHRDVKPANVLVAPPLKLTDFGASKSLVRAGEGLTLPGTSIGTPGYMAPELFGDAANADARADLYAVAATLYRMLAGRLPFEAKSYEEHVVLARTTRPPPLASVTQGLPPLLCAIVDRGLAPERDARWQSADELREALHRAMTSSDAAPSRTLIEPDVPTQAASPPAVERSARKEASAPTGLILAALAALLVVSVGGGVLGAKLMIARKSKAIDGPPLVSPNATTPPPTLATSTSTSTASLSPPPLPTPTPTPTPPPSRPVVFSVVPSVTDHVSRASLDVLFARAASLASACRMTSASTRVAIQLLVNGGKVTIAQVPLSSTGDARVAACVAQTLHDVSATGNAPLVGAGIVDLIAVVPPR